MTKMKITDDPLQRIGATMHNARSVCHISRSELAGLLCIPPADLAAYEHGKTQPPPEILEHLFLMGYTMMRVRVLEHRYRQNRQTLRRLKRIIATVP